MDDRHCKMDNKHVLKFSSPGIYRIRVQGELNESWSDRLGGLAIEVTGSGREAVTTLTGYLIDQAALLGVINALYNMHYSLLFVEYLPNERKK